MPSELFKRLRALRWPTALLLTVLPVNAPNAATSLSNFGVQMTIQAACSVESTTDLNFGTVGGLSTNIDITSTITVRCSNTTAFSIGLDQGQHGASVTTRQMQGGPASERINYTITSDSSRSVNWGSTIGSDTVAGIGTGTSQAFTVYGRVPPQTTPAAGIYSDTVTVTVTY